MVHRKNTPSACWFDFSLVLEVETEKEDGEENSTQRWGLRSCTANFYTAKTSATPAPNAMHHLRA